MADLPAPPGPAPSTPSPSDRQTDQGLTERILAEGPLGLAAGSRRLGALRAGNPVRPGTLARWAGAGVALPDGTRLKLEAIRLSGRWVTSWPAVIRFVTAQQVPG